MLRKLFATNKDVIPIFLRLTLGAVIFPHGAQKVLGWFGGGGFKVTLEGMTGMGLPAAIVVMVMVAEFLGSLGLIFGFLTRLSALGVISVMLGAIFTVHQQYGFFMNWIEKQAGKGFEYHLLTISIAVALLMRENNAFSIDHALEGPQK